jgi:phosphoserine phosphatase
MLNSVAAMLVHVSGPDQPGLTHSLTEVLAQHQVRILDIGQSLLHDLVSMGILIEMTPELERSPLLSQLLLRAQELGVQVRFSPISRNHYASWVAEQQKRRYIITVLGRSIHAAHIADVTGTIAAEMLNIDRVERLSSRVPLEEPHGRACVEFSVSGEPHNEAELRESLMSIAQRHSIDIAFQHDNMYRRNRRLVAFDMDSTLIQAEMIDELAKAAGVGEQVAKITEAAMRGEVDFPGAFRQRVSLLKGLPESRLEDIAARIPLMDGAERLVSTLRRLGYKTAILSGGFGYFGRRLQAQLGIDYLYANELDIRDGALTGEIHTEIVDGQVKARRLREIADKEGISLEQVIAVGDGANDLPMIQLAGLGIAFRAKPVVRANARQSLSTLGLDGILYLIGVRDRDTD